MAGHSEGVVVDEFCAIRAEKCSLHGNEYQKNCDPPPNGWEGTTFLQGSKEKVLKKPEAHHLLCVACVTEFVAKDSKLKDVVRQTPWCINDTVNMFAMPLWGHTIKWYCNNFDEMDLDRDSVGDLIDAGDLFSKKTGPKFKNIPQHDYDHNSGLGYKQEVDRDLKQLASQIRDVAKNSHEDASSALAGELEELSKKFRSELQRRGKRAGGTHNAWSEVVKGVRKPHSDWYKPFSMANDGKEEARVFPVSGADSGKLANKIRRMVDALRRWSGT
jgi:hypothetical protein